MRVVSGIFGFAFAIAASLFIRQIGTALMGGDIYLAAPVASLALWGALGVLASGRFAGRRGSVPTRENDEMPAHGEAHSVSALCWVLTLCGIILPATIVLIRAVPWLFIEPAGPLYEMRRAVAMNLLLLLPAGLSGGLVLGLLCRAASEEEEGAEDAVMVLICGGGFVGGLAFSLILAGWAPPLQLAGAVGFLLAASGFLLWLAREGGGRGWGFLMTPPALVALVVAFPPAGSVLDFAANKLRLPGQILIENRHSAFAEMDAVSPAGGRPVFADAESLGMRRGLPLTEDSRLFIFGGHPVGANYEIERAEETAHLALAWHPAPRSVLIVGGGASGVVTHALKHPTVARIDYVEIDPAFASFIERNSVEPESGAFQSPIVAVHERIDGVRFARDAERQYDVIILAVPDPTTGVFSRYYTVEFLRNIRNRLAPGGIAMANLSSGPGYVTRARRFMFASVSRTLSATFEDVSRVGGDDHHYFIMTRDGHISVDAAEIQRRLDERGVVADWLDGERIEELLSPSRVNLSLLLMGLEADDGAVGRQRSPISYRYSALYRAPRFGVPASAGFGERLGLAHYAVFVWAAAFLIVAAALISHRRRAISCRAIALFAGASASVLWVTFIMMFQGYYGTSYGFVGAFFAASMLGLAVGVECGAFASKTTGWRTYMAAAMVAVGGCALLMPRAMSLLRESLEAGWPGRFAFVAAAIFVFWLIGIVIPSARRGYNETAEAGDGQRRIIMWALLGAGIGALAAGTAFVPFMGIYLSACVAAFLAFAGAVQFVMAE